MERRGGKIRIKHRVHSHTRGASLIESTLIIPVLLFFAFSVVELGRAMEQYTLLVSIVEEGARAASRMPGVESGALRSAYDTNTDTSTTLAFNSPGGVNVPAKHTNIRNLVTTLIRLNLDSLKIRDVVVETSFTEADGVSENSDTIIVILEATYTGLFSDLHSIVGTIGLDGISMKTQAFGPYIDQQI